MDPLDGDNLLLIASEVELNEKEKANSSGGNNSEDADSTNGETVPADIFAKE